MKLEKFDYSSGKRGRWFLYGVICTVLLMILINLFFSEAKYLNTESIKIAEGSISYKPYDFKIMAMYQKNGNGEYEEIETMPTGNYKINEEKSYCTLDNINKDNNAILKTNTNGEHIINNLSKNDKCYLYFDKAPQAGEIILANMISITTRGSITGVNTASTTGTIYTAEDDNGTSYYFSGNSTDNWVKFAEFYWRIIRINGDGTIRMIYQGTNANETGEGTQIGTSAFNLNYNNNMYVGYMYTSGQVHGTATASTIKSVLDIWYDSNLGSYSSYIDANAGFCGDRNVASGHSSYPGNGIGITAAAYAPADRLLTANLLSWKTTQTPTLKCSNINDLYTLSNSSKGNKALSKPIGLITSDEVVYGGGFGGATNSSYYLYTDRSYWTMSPTIADSNGWARVFYVNSNGGLNDFNGVAWTEPGVRPVINLKANTQFKNGSDGTIDNPYVVA